MSAAEPSPHRPDHASPHPSARRPNLCFILSDDHAAHAIGAYGSRVNQTPRLDELASAGARFEHCFATNSLCAPSRASLLTGTYSHVNGVTTLLTPIDASQPTFVSLLQQAGYRTAIVGKWHMGHGATDGVRHDPVGFDHWEVLVGQGEYWDPQLLSEDGIRVEEGYATDVLTDLALGWLDTLEGDQPWCLLLWHKAPHRSWEPHPRHARLYQDAVPLPETWDDDYATRSASMRRGAMRVADHLTLEDLKQPVPEGLSYDDAARWKYQRYLEDYLRCVAAVDQSVGRVVDRLRERGELDDTLLVYASDQGFFLGDHGWFDKRYMYEESLRMPLLVAWPARIAPGQVHEGIVTNVDVAQAFLEAAGVEPDPRMQGRSFLRDLTGEPAPPPAEGLYYRYWEHDDSSHHASAHYGYRTERYKLIYFYNDGLGLPGTSSARFPPEWELYDLQADPGEVRNVADEPSYAAVRAQLTAAMATAQAAVGDTPHPSQQSSMRPR